MTTTTPVGAPGSRTLRRVGHWCLAAGLAGAIQGGIVLAWPPQVPDTRFSYPFDDTGYVIAQLSFFLQHLPLVVGVAALLRLPGVRASRAAAIGIDSAVVGLGLLAVAELVAIAAHDAAADSHRADLVEAMYGPPVILIGVGLGVAGLDLLRKRFDRWVGAAWMPLLIAVLGLYVVVPLTPALSSGFAAGRFAIGGWMVLFAALGYGLAQLSATQCLEETP